MSQMTAWKTQTFAQTNRKVEVKQDELFRNKTFRQKPGWKASLKSVVDVLKSGLHEMLVSLSFLLRYTSHTTELFQVYNPVAVSAFVKVPEHTRQPQRSHTHSRTKWLWL